MGLLLAPYNNAMRLGQGFNSYIQEICVDDAVIIDPARAENTITNDGMTMKQYALMMTKEDAWTLAGAAPKSVESPPENATKVGQEHKSEVTETSQEATKSEPPGKGSGAEGEASGNEGSPGAGKHESAAETQKQEETAPSEEGELVEAPMEETGNNTKEETPTATDEKFEQGKGGGGPEPSAGNDGGLGQGGEAKSAQGGVVAKSDEAQKQGTSGSAGQASTTVAKKEKTLKEKKADQDREQAIERAKKASAVTPYTQADMDELFGVTTEAKRKELKGKQNWSFKSTGRRGPSQIVTYTSKFVDKLSDVTEDMNISGAFSIRYNMIGGSAKGAFIDANKFKESDLNFYISVKVVNQTINFKDALVFNDVPCRTADNFQKIFGDSFISGFIEGGEFNALVSMKVLNKESKTALAAEAKVALTASVAEISGEAKVQTAKQNLSKSTEMTIQVSWSGGGHIKPMDQQWDIDSLTEAAARFPDLVALTPQRTYAILTKYDSLRSWISMKPAGFTPLQYDVAQVYTNSLMDTFMDYKSIYTQLTSDMSDIQSGLKKFTTNNIAKDNNEKSPSRDKIDDRYITGDPTTPTPDSSAVALPEVKPGAAKKNPRDVVVPPFIHDEKVFPPSLKGLAWACRVVRFQMISIVNEVDAITQDPTIATDSARPEVFQNSFFFRDRLPKVGLVAEEPSVSLTEKPIGDPENTSKPSASLYVPYPRTDNVTKSEQQAIDEVTMDNKDIGKHLRLTALSGDDSDSGDIFSNLEFLKPTFIMSSISFYIADGAVVGLALKYSNGLALTRGVTTDKTKTIGPLENLGVRERVIACTIEEGRPVKEPRPNNTEAAGTSTGKPKLRVTSVRLYTNRGHALIAQADDWSFSSRKREGERGRIDYTDLVTKEFDPPIEGGYLKGFWGRNVDDISGSSEGGIVRLGCIWGNAH